MSSVNAAQNLHLRSPGRGPGLNIRLLGPFHVDLAGGAITIPSRKVRALLAYLVQRRGSEVPRGTLTGLLWGERGEEQARASLRQALSELRSALSAASPMQITATADAVGWNDGPAWIDTSVIEDAAASTDPQSWRDAAHAMRGEFLEGLAIDEPAFEQWLAAERQRLHILSATVLIRLMEHEENAGDLETALGHGLRLVAADPLQEHVHRNLMRLHMAQGRPDAALAQFERCRRELEGQLGIQPAPETLELARTIRANRRGGNPPPPRVASTPPPILPEKPSIAVLPFANLSSNHEQQFFADGMTEDIIGALSRIGDLFVISRGSSFIYKGRAVLAQDAAHELGVHYILEGSVRIAGNRVRVNAQLVDGITGGQAWAEHYEGELDDIFAVQDDITRSIAQAMQVKLVHGESGRLWEGQTTNLRAWEQMVLARQAFLTFTTAANDRSRLHLEEAIRLDPTCAGAIAQLGISYYWDARYSISMDMETSIRLAESCAARLDGLNVEMATAQSLRGFIAFIRDRLDDAKTLMARAVELAPGDSRNIGNLGWVQIYTGETDEALKALNISRRLSPSHESWQLYYTALAQLWHGDLPASRHGAEHYLQLWPDEPYGYALLATVCGFQGQPDRSAALIAKLREKVPEFSLVNIRRSERYRDPLKSKRLIEILRQAGLPG